MCFQSNTFCILHTFPAISIRFNDQFIIIYLKISFGFFFTNNDVQQYNQKTFHEYIMRYLILLIDGT